MYKKIDNILLYRDKKRVDLYLGDYVYVDFYIEDCSVDCYIRTFDSVDFLYRIILL